MLNLTGFRCEEFIHFGILGEMVLKGDDGVAEEQQPFAGAHIGHVGKLVRRKVQVFRQCFPVAGCLGQHINEAGVVQDVVCTLLRSQVLDVLGDAGGNAAPLSKPLPDLHGISSGLGFFQQNMEFIHIVPGVFPAVPVGRQTVPHHFLHDQHSHLFQLCA